MGDMIRRVEDCTNDFEIDCVKTVQRIAQELQDIYDGKVESETEDGEMMTLIEYFDDFLDVNYTVNYRREYKSASICIGYGGPNIYIDTDDAYVKLYWGATRAEAPFSYTVRDAIDDIFAEYYEIAA